VHLLVWHTPGPTPLAACINSSSRHVSQHFAKSSEIIDERVLTQDAALKAVVQAADAELPAVIAATQHTC
jgi:hypothetical protein